MAADKTFVLDTSVLLALAQRISPALRRSLSTSRTQLSIGLGPLLCGDPGTCGDPSRVPQIGVVFPDLGVEHGGLPEGLLVDHSVHERVRALLAAGALGEKPEVFVIL